MPLTLADGRTKLTILTTAPANKAAITAAELTAGISAEGKVNKPDYRLSATSSDVVPDQPLSHEGNAQTWGNSNYEGSLTVLRFLTSAGVTDTSEDVLWAAMKAKGTTLWAVERVGPKSTQAWAAADVYEVYEFVTDNPQRPQDRAGYVKHVIPLGIQDVKSGVVAA